MGFLDLLDAIVIKTVSTVYEECRKAMDEKQQNRITENRVGGSLGSAQSPVEQTRSEHEKSNTTIYDRRARRKELGELIGATRRAYKVYFDGEIEYIHSKVSGVTYNDRQRYVKNLIDGQYLKVCREKDNRYDKNAIALYDGNHQIGYIKKELAEKLAPILDSGKAINVQVNKVTGTDVEGHYCGVNILISYEISPKKSGYTPVATLSPIQHQTQRRNYYDYDDDDDDGYRASTSWSDYVDDLYDGNYEQAEDDWNEKFYD